jgi:hypothetical protein
MQKQILDQIILQLKQIEVDGESMEYIIKEVGMEDQMLRQLLLKADMELVQELVEEKALLEYDPDLYASYWQYRVLPESDEWEPEYDSAGFSIEDRIVNGQYRVLPESDENE